MSDVETKAAITTALASCLPKCGDCYKWMMSRECPRERNVKGMSRGPSCGAMACDQFTPKNAETAARVAERKQIFDAFVMRQASN